MNLFLLLTIIGTAMTMPYRILGTDEAAQPIIDATFAHVDATFNDYNPDSELSRFNRWPAKKPFAASTALIELLRIADHFVTMSEGRFDPSLGKGWHLLEIGEKTLTKRGELELDLGAIAKGHAVDLLLAALQDAGYNDLYVDWAGEIAVSGRPRRIAVRHPADEAPLALLDLQDAAIATSGNYIQGDHIVGNSIVTSATVIADTCAAADALATAAMVCSSQREAETFVAEIEGLDTQFQILICLTN